MSNPPSVPKPNPYFSGIIYNPTDFLSVSGDTVLTYAQASALFIQKTIADSVSGITNFINGITTSSILAKTISATCNLWTNATGEIFIGTLGGRSATIHIGDGNSNLAGSGVHINNGTNTASNVQILNGTGSTGAINLGSATSTTNVNCPLTLIYAPSLLTGTSMIGYTTRDDYTFTGTIPNSANQVLFSSDVSLPTGVWLINYYIRIISASSTVISSYNSFGNTNRLAITGQYYGGVGIAGNQTVTGALPCASSGSFVIQSGVSSITQYNIQVYIVGVSGGTLSLDTGTSKGYCIRTRIG